MHTNQKTRIVLLFGGIGAEHEISLKTASSMARAMVDACELTTVGIRKDGSICLYTGTPDGIESGAWEEESERLFPTSFVRLGNERGLLLGNTVLPVDVVLPALHGDYGEDGKLQGALEISGIPYVGARPLAGAICQDKAITKILAQHLSIPTVPWCLVHSGTPFAEAKLQIRASIPKEEYPLILKPTSLGSSIGVFPVANDTSLREALDASAKYGDMLVEKYLPAPREVEVCYLETQKEDCFFVGEVNLPDPTTPYTFDKKYRLPLSPVRQEPLPKSIQRTLIRYSRALVNLLSVRGLCRLDYFLVGEKIYFNEINTFPGLSSQSFYPEVCKRNGFDYKTLLFTLCEVAYDRHLR